MQRKKYWERGKLKPTTSSTPGQWRSSWKKNLPYKNDMLFTQMFQSILAQAPPGGSEHNNCCNYSNQIWCERSPLCVTHRGSSREHQLRQGDNQDEHGRYVDNVNKSRILQRWSASTVISHTCARRDHQQNQKLTLNTTEFLALLLMSLCNTSGFIMLLHKH